MSEQSETPEKTTPIRAYYKYELAFLYGVGLKAFDEWLKPYRDRIGEQRGRKFTPQQVRIIFECLDPPC